VLISLSVILTASVLFPSISSRQIVEIMIGCAAGAVLAGAYIAGRRLVRSPAPAAGVLAAAGAVSAGLVVEAGTVPAARSGGAAAGAADTVAGAADTVAGAAGAADTAARDSWRMPPLALLKRPVMSTGRKIGMSALRVYLAVAMILVILKIVQLAMGH
jgi:hypothetical protein